LVKGPKLSPGGLAVICVEIVSGMVES